MLSGYLIEKNEKIWTKNWGRRKEKTWIVNGTWKKIWKWVERKIENFKREKLTKIKTNQKWNDTNS